MGQSSEPDMMREWKCPRGTNGLYSVSLVEETLICWHIYGAQSINVILAVHIASYQAITKVHHVLRR